MYMTTAPTSAPGTAHHRSPPRRRERSGGASCWAVAPALRSWPSAGILWSRQQPGTPGRQRRVVRASGRADATVVACLTGSRWRPGRSCNEPSRRSWPPSTPAPDSSSRSARRGAGRARPVERVGRRGRHPHRDTEYRARRDLSYAQDARRRRKARRSCSSTCRRRRCSGNRRTPCGSRSARSRGRGWRSSSGWRPAPRSDHRRTVAGDRTVAGFDVFTGLPETWRTGFPAGEFAQEPPDIPGATVVAGLFEDTLPAFLAETDEAIAFVHVDCDLYSSTKTVLDLRLTGSRPTRCWCSTSSSTTRAGSSTSSGPGPNSSSRPAALRVSGLHRQQRTGRRAPALISCRRGVPSSPGRSSSGSASR